MKQTSPLQRVCSVLQWFLALAAAALAALTVFHTVLLYREGLTSGRQMYTPEAITAHASALKWPLLCFAVLLVLTAVLRLLLPRAERPVSLTAQVRQALSHWKQQTEAPAQRIRIALLAAAVLLIVLGILNGGMYDVLVKAINICTECIGLG